MKYSKTLFSFIYLIVSSSCTHIYPSSGLYTPIPDKWRAPLQKKPDIGFYECGSKIAQCVSKKDILTMIENKANMEEAQRQLVKLIDGMNDQVVEEVHCAFWDLKCKRTQKDKEAQQSQKP